MLRSQRCQKEVKMQKLCIKNIQILLLRRKKKLVKSVTKIVNISKKVFVSKKKQKNVENCKLKAKYWKKNSLIKHNKTCLIMLLDVRKKLYKLTLKQLSACKNQAGKRLKKLKKSVEPDYNQWISMLLIRLGRENSQLHGRNIGKRQKMIADLLNKFKELKER